MSDDDLTALTAEYEEEPLWSLRDEGHQTDARADRGYPDETDAAWTLFLVNRDSHEQHQITVEYFDSSQNDGHDPRQRVTAYKNAETPPRWLVISRNGEAVPEYE